MKKRTYVGTQTTFAVRENQPVCPLWKHPGAKLVEVGAKDLSTQELVAILVSTGYKGKTALEISNELLNHYGTLRALSNVPLAKLLEIKGLGDVKIVRIAAALELGRRTAEEILEKHKRR
jgi:DNA repair protein RadC